jgi:signal transduction histidine kinase
LTEEDVPAIEANLLSSLVSSLPGMAYRCENSPERRMKFVSNGVQALTGRARIPVHTQFKGDAQLSPEVKVALYRIAQESLNNIAKHANAENVSLEIFCEPDQNTLIIRDDGCDFDTDDLSSENLGLGIMQERTEQIGADLNISSQPGQGTQVMVQLNSDSH